MILTLGTWGFYKSGCQETIESVIAHAIKQGVTHFDTALVYGEGAAERCLGTFSSEPISITTKIPGIIKPVGETPISHCYTRDWILRCTERSLINLHRIDTLLLHNWSSFFENDCDLEPILYALDDIKRSGLCKRVGISLPNHFNGILSERVCSACDVVMLPYNDENQWAVLTADYLKSQNIDLMVRSIFRSGKHVPSDVESRRKVINSASFGDELVIGTTSCKHLDELISLV